MTTRRLHRLRTVAVNRVRHVLGLAVYTPLYVLCAAYTAALAIKETLDAEAREA